MKTIKQLLMTVVVLLCSATANAHDFEVDGIYYNIISTENSKVEVTYKGSTYSFYSDEYNGNVVIPSSVNYNGKNYSVTSIGDNAFYNCSSLTSIEIPNSVTSIGEYAFYHCSSLTSIEIPNSVTSIGYGAFYYCSSLTSIEIPNGVTSIGDFAFYECSGLTSVTIPNSVTSIGYGAFYYCSSLTSIEIPNSVTSIGDNAFYNCSSLTSIEIPNSVTSIGEYAFYHCSSLTSIEIPNSVTSIGSGAFNDTPWYNNQPDGFIYIGKTLYAFKGEIPNGTSVNIKDGTLYIAGGAFRFCKGLTKVTIPKSVTSIGTSVFSSCDNLSSIIVEEGNTKYDSRGNCNAIVETATNTIIQGCSSTIIHESVENIGDYAFAGMSLQKLIIPYNIKNILRTPFLGCNIKDFNIEYSDSALKYDSRTFESMSIENLYLNRNLIRKNNYDNISSYIHNSIVIGDSVTERVTFRNAEKLKKLILKSKKIEHEFGSIDSLTELTIDENVKDVLNLPNCSYIKKLNIENSENVLNVADEFKDCPIDILYIGRKISNKNTLFYNDTIKSLTLAENAIDLKSNVFSGCSIDDLYVKCGEAPISIFSNSTIKGLKFGKNVEKINGNIDAEKLEYISIDNGNKTFDSRNNCNAIIETATNTLLIGCKNSVIPNGLKKIEKKAFYGCGIINVNIPNSVTNVGGYAFYGCKNLEQVAMSQNVSTIEEYTFYGCSGLTSIKIPNSVTNVGGYAFYGCKNLEQVAMSQNISTIEEYTFYGCSSLTSIKIPNSVTSIGGHAFEYCNDLKNIVFGENITSIGTYAFSECNNITEVIIPKSVTSIGEGAFCVCENLKSVHISENVTDFGESPFYGCKNLKRVYVNCKRVVCGFLNGNTSFEEIVLGNNVIGILDNALSGCSGIKTIRLTNSIPPKVGANNFTSSHYQNATLYVPKGSLATYQSADTWKDFWDIQEFDPTGIDDVVDDAPVFEITAGGIQFTAAEGKAVTIYSTSGALVEKIDCYDGEEIMLDRGVYIVRVGGKAVKVKL